MLFALVDQRYADGSHWLSPVPYAESAKLPDNHHAKLIIQSRAASFFEPRGQFLLVRVDHEHGQQFRGCGLAGVLTNAMPVAGHL